MSIRPYRDIVRRKSRQVMVGPVPVGEVAIFNLGDRFAAIENVMSRLNLE